jgi:hypothetical protein
LACIKWRSCHQLWDQRHLLYHKLIHHLDGGFIARLAGICGRHSAKYSSGLGSLYEQSGLLGSRELPSRFFAQDMTFVFGLNAVLIYLLINGLESATKRAQTNAKELKIINTDLTSAQTICRPVYEL